MNVIHYNFSDSDFLLITLFCVGIKDFGWSLGSDDVEIVTSRNCLQGFVNESIEDETVYEQYAMNLGDGYGVNVGDGVNVGVDDGVNLISTSSS